MSEIKVIDLKNHSLPAEAAIIADVLINPEYLTNCYELLPEHFYSKAHAIIWEAINNQFDNKEPISLFSIAGKFKDSPLFEEAGGAVKYLSGCLSQTTLYPHSGETIRYLIDLARKRALEYACQTSNLDDVIQAVADYKTSLQKGEFFDNYQITEKILDSLKTDTNSYSTGLKLLDEAMDGGVYPKKSYGFAARKKMGKTMLGATLSHNLNLSGVKHLFICGEMSPEEIQTRILCRVMDCYQSKFRKYDENFSKELAQKMRAMPKNVIYRNAPALTFDELKQCLDESVSKFKIKGLILDYWQLVGGKPKSKSNSEHLDEVAQWIADYCRKKDLFSIVFAQINQEGNTRGGEGIRLAFDQVYELKAPKDDPSRSGRWLEMRDTRYTKWINIGSDETSKLFLQEKGLYFQENP